MFQVPDAYQLLPRTCFWCSVPRVNLDGAVCQNRVVQRRDCYINYIRACLLHLCTNIYTRVLYFIYINSNTRVFAAGPHPARRQQRRTGLHRSRGEQQKHKNRTKQTEQNRSRTKSPTSILLAQCFGHTRQSRVFFCGVVVVAALPPLPRLKRPRVRACLM